MASRRPSGRRGPFGRSVPCTTPRSVTSLGRTCVSGLRRGRSFFEGPSATYGLSEFRHPRSFLRVQSAKSGAVPSDGRFRADVPSSKCHLRPFRSAASPFVPPSSEGKVQSAKSGRSGPLGRPVPCPTSKCHLRPFRSAASPFVPPTVRRGQAPSAKCKVLSAKCGAVGRSARVMIWYI